MIKKFCKKGMKWIWLGMASFIVAFAILISVGRILFAFTSGYKSTVEHLASQFLGHPVKIERAHGSWHGLQPVFKLRNVSIYSSDHRKILTTVKKLDIGLDLIDSLLHWRIEPGEFALSDLDVNVYQKKDNTINVNALNFNFQTKPDADIWASADKFYNLLLTPGNKIVRNLSLTWHGKDGEVFSIQKINAKLISRVLDHRLILHGHLSNPYKTDLKLILNLQGNRLAKRFTGIEGYAKINNIHVGSWTEKLDLPIRATRGAFDSTVWFNLQNQKLNKVHALVKAKNITLISDIIEHPIKAPELNAEIVWNRDKKKFGEWRGQFKTLTLKYPGIPEMENLSGIFEMSSDHGKIQLFGNDVSLVFNRFFNEKFKFHNAYFNARWVKNASGWEIYSPAFAFKNQDATLIGELRVKIPKGKASPHIELQASGKLNNIAHLRQYLPHNILKKPLDDWLSTAFLSGRLSDVQMVVHGDVDKFPFDHSEGVFEVKGQFSNLNLHYRESWPDIKKLYGRIYFDGRSMHVRARHGRIYDQPIRMVMANIDNLAKPEIKVNGSVKTDLSNAIDFIHHSPLEKTVGKELHDLKLLGPMQLGLKMDIPLHNKLPIRVKGDVKMENAQILLDDWQLNAKNLNGDLCFTEESLSSNTIKMQLFDRPVGMTIQTLHPENSDYSQTVVYVSGETNIDELRGTFSLPETTLLKGNTKYKAKLLLHRSDDSEPDSITLLSDLEGVKINLPEPLGKEKDMQKYLKLSLDLLKEKPMKLQFSYDDQVLGNLLLNISTKNKQGDLIKKIQEVDLKFKKLRLFNQYFKDLNILVKNDALDYLVDIDSSEIKGSIRIPYDLPQDVISAEFDYLKLSPFEAGEQKILAPEDFFPLNLAIQKLYYNKQFFGNLKLSLTPEKGVLRINHFALDSPRLRLSTTGMWRVLPDFQETTLTGVMRTDALGELLKTADVNADLVGGKGRATFTLAWFDSLLHPTVAKLNGRVQLEFSDGQITKLSKDTRKKVGFGRVLNLFSLQSLPKRLTLNFSDLAQKGFMFDEMKGDFVLKSGDAFTENAYLEGSVARVGVNGRLGLDKKDYDIKLMITPNVTSSLPVVAAITGGPIAGVATLFAETVVSKAVGDITTSAYEIKGTWTEPQVTKIGK